MRRAVYAAALVLMSFVVVYAKDAAPLTDGQIQAHLVAASLASYSGSCPCPESMDKAGRRCGKRSAYSRPGGEEPLCSSTDVTAEMIAEFRKGAAR